MIVSFFRNHGNYVDACSPRRIPTSTLVLPRWAATPLAGVWLYESRGLRDDTRERTPINIPPSPNIGRRRKWDRIARSKNWTPLPPLATATPPRRPRCDSRHKSY